MADWERGEQAQTAQMMEILEFMKRGTKKGQSLRNWHRDLSLTPRCSSVHTFT